MQQLHAGQRSVALVDELESGLEPHRAVRLLNYLLTDEDYSQVVVTTHSPVIVEQSRIENLATVRNSGGTVTVTSLGAASVSLQRLRRAAPSSLLARKVIVAEGKTEHGILLSCMAAWDNDRAGSGLSTSAGEGVAIQDGGGGSEVGPRAAALAEIGYGVAGILDNDDPTINSAVTRAQDAGALMVRWDQGLCTEQQVCAGLDSEMLTSFIRLGVERRSSEATVYDDLRAYGAPAGLTSLEVGTWLVEGATIETARTWVSTAANKRKWFKEVDDGRALGDWLVKHAYNPQLKTVIERLDLLRAFVFSDAGTIDAAPATREFLDVERDG